MAEIDRSNTEFDSNTKDDARGSAGRERAREKKMLTDPNPAGAMQASLGNAKNAAAELLGEDSFDADAASGPTGIGQPAGERNGEWLAAQHRP